MSAPATNEVAAIAFTRPPSRARANGPLARRSPGFSRIVTTAVLGQNFRSTCFRRPTMRNRINEEITFRKLEVLLAFMEAGSLAKAAEALGVSTVSVHRALHTLEEGMHWALFRHEGRNLLPTEAAQVLAEVADEVIKTMRELLLMAGGALGDADGGEKVVAAAECGTARRVAPLRIRHFKIPFVARPAATVISHSFG